MSVATLINHKGWVFEGVHNSYTVALVGVTRSSRSSPASIPDSGPSMESTAGTRSRWSQSTRSTAEPTLGGGFEEIDEPHVAIYPGPANSLPHFREVVYGKPELIPVSEFSRWSSSAAFPQIPTRSAFSVWRKIKRQPRFDGTDQREREREREILRRNWRFRPVQGDFNSTIDRHRWYNDGGSSARSQSSTPPTTETTS